MVNANGHLGNGDALHDCLRSHHGQRATQSANAVHGNRAAVDDDFLTGDAIGKTDPLGGCGAGWNGLAYFATQRVDAHRTRCIDRHRIAKARKGYVPPRLQSKAGRAILLGVNQQGKRAVRQLQAGGRAVAHGASYVAGPDQETRRGGLGRGGRNHLQRLDIRAGKTADKRHVHRQAVRIRHADRDIGARVIVHLVKLRFQNRRDGIGLHAAHVHFRGPYIRRSNPRHNRRWHRSVGLSEGHALNR